MKQIKFTWFLIILLSATSCSIIKNSSNDSAEKKRSLYSEKLGLALEKNYDEKLIKEVIGWLGTPYVYGGEEKSGTDCSGFIMQVYKVIYGKETARSASGLYEQCIKVKKEKLQQGELVFFKINTEKVGHVGIFLQDSYFIHASSSKGVMVSSLETEYWAKYFVSGGRLE